ncbi:group 1 truncated hemoglobin [Algoriphagus sp. D3-2-R+10]|uniref:group I truncated hemoglobin n=1 Tax=Algoriphagus aurantiacus TaxID=3103948 RepID=UPI002B3A9DDF|nr:group 1 truncated hemoglobin [Algoriphagus sp. D3-2-R+10]MEB2776777.1 group 1 truncated hemoglobin [Algoriphagus sp. D3-2-R+10]
MDSTGANPQKPLYERLGGESGIIKIVNDVLDKNFNNPLVGYHFKNIDMDKLKRLVFEFFSMGTGGPHEYRGRDMRTAHTGMQINMEEWESATDDMVWALDNNGIGEKEKNEVITILESFKGDIVGV